MTEPRSSSGPDSEQVAAATGVAAGGLGTGANLDDTQVFRTEDLAAPSASATEPPAAPQAEPNPEPIHHGPVPALVAAASVAAVPVAAAPVRATVARRATSSSRQRGRGVAGVLAAALVVLAGVAFVVTRDTGTPAAGQTVPSAAAPATTQPDGAAGGADKGDPGRGTGKDKPCRGNGNGRGCDDDDD